MTAYRMAFSKMVLRSKIPQGDSLWGEFNGSFDNLELEPVDIANLIYTGHPFTTWHKNHWRHTNNYQLGQHVGIDFDTEDERSTLPYLAKDKFISRYANLIYTTPSHRPEAPRARVLFLLDTPIEKADAYGEIVQFLMAQFDDPDTGCKDASRFFYGSMNCDLAMPDNVLPLAQLRRLYAVDKRTSRRRKPARATPDLPVINLEAERTKRRAAALTQNTPDELEKARAALDKIGAYDVDYNTWIGIIAAMRDEFGEAAFPIVERWAQGKPGEVRREWDRVKAGSKKAMHMGTIHYLAAGKR